MIITFGNILRQTINEIANTQYHPQLIEVLTKMLKQMEDEYDFRSNEYRFIKRLIRKVEYNRHSHQQDYYQLKAEIIAILSRMV